MIFPDDDLHFWFLSYLLTFRMNKGINMRHTSNIYCKAMKFRRERGVRVLVASSIVDSREMEIIVAVMVAYEMIVADVVEDQMVLRPVILTIKSQIPKIQRTGQNHGVAIIVVENQNIP